MKIAVASQNFRTVTAHAGKTRRFLIFEADAAAAPVETARLDLPIEQAFHNFHGDGPHPLDGVQALIAASAGEGVIRRLAARGITVVATTESDPAAAAGAFAAGTLPRALPQDGHGCHAGLHE